ncbi:FtsX-like permease family protein, partial [Nocardioides zeicaulis]
AAAGALVGVASVRLLAGAAGWVWSLPVVAVATAAPPLLGVALAGATTRRDRAPANRTARRSRARAAGGLRALVEVVVGATAVLAWVALRQRGVVGKDGTGGDATAASAAVWVSVAAALLLLRVLPAALAALLAATRRLAGAVPLFVAARLSSTPGRALPTVAVVVAVSQLVLGVSLVVTLHHGQAAGARVAVGGDVRFDARPDPAVARLASQVASSPGVRAAAAARVEDGVRVSGSDGSALVRLVAVSPADLARVREASGLPGGDLDRLAGDRLAGDGDGDDDDRVPALLLGGTAGLRRVPSLDWEGVRVPLEVVGDAPDPGAGSDAVLVVDATSLARAGVAAAPDTVWASGTGAAAAVSEAARQAGASGAVVTYAGELARRRDAPLPSAMTDLGVASCVVLQLLALLAVALAAASDAPERRSSVGRLRALGLPRRDLTRVLAGDLVAPVTVASAVGALVGAVCAHLALGSFALERLTSTRQPPAAVVPWWTVGSVVLLVCGAGLLAVAESRRVRGTPLARLLRS